jgi:hypothetical protein
MPRTTLDLGYAHSIRFRSSTQALAKPAVHDARWLFFDLGNTLISEEAATLSY